MTLTEFLLARIAEDEDGPFFNAWHVRRVHAECAAKRTIIAAIHAWESMRPPDLGGEFVAVTGVIHYPLRPLAAIYADHPDYDETWRP